MTLWCLLLIVQPVLIIKRRHDVHRIIGKTSWILVPVIIASMWLVIRFSYFRMHSTLNAEDNLTQIFLPFSQMVLFVFFYGLAVINTHNPKIHMRYIIISSVSLLGPTIGRINFTAIGLGSLDMDLWTMNLLLLGFTLYDLTKGVRFIPYYAGLFAYASMHWAYYNFSTTETWRIMAKILLQI